MADVVLVPRVLGEETVCYRRDVVAGCVVGGVVEHFVVGVGGGSGVPE